MCSKFHERFDIVVSLGEAKRRFVNRVNNDIFRPFIDENLSQKESVLVKRNIASRLGEPYGSQKPVTAYTGMVFLRRYTPLKFFITRFLLSYQPKRKCL
jgi:hypothetical protein